MVLVTIKLVANTATTTKKAPPGPPPGKLVRVEKILELFLVGVSDQVQGLEAITGFFSS